MSEVREVVYKGVRIEIEQIKSLLSEAVKSGLISQEEMTHCLIKDKTFVMENTEEFVTLQFWNDTTICMYPKEILRQLLWYRDNKSEVITEHYHKQESKTDVAMVETKAKDIPLKIIGLLEGMDYQQSQLILNACQEMIKTYSSVSLKDSNASSNTLGANVSCSNVPS